MGDMFKTSLSAKYHFKYLITALECLELPKLP